MSISEANPLKVGDKVRLTGGDWGDYRGQVVTVDTITFGKPWSSVPGISSLALDTSEEYGGGYAIERAQDGDSELTLPEKAVKIVENLTSVGFTKEQACEIVMLAVRQEAQNV